MEQHQLKARELLQKYSAGINKIQSDVASVDNETQARKTLQGTISVIVRHGDTYADVFPLLEVTGSNKFKLFRKALQLNSSIDFKISGKRDTAGRCCSLTLDKPHRYSLTNESAVPGSRQNPISVFGSGLQPEQIEILAGQLATALQAEAEAKNSTKAHTAAVPAVPAVPAATPPSAVRGRPTSVGSDEDNDNWATEDDAESVDSSSSTNSSSSSSSSSDSDDDDSPEGRRGGRRATSLPVGRSPLRKKRRASSSDADDDGDDDDDDVVEAADRVGYFVPLAAAAPASPLRRKFREGSSKTLQEMRVPSPLRRDEDGQIPTSRRNFHRSKGDVAGDISTVKRQAWFDCYYKYSHLQKCEEIVKSRVTIVRLNEKIRKLKAELKKATLSPALKRKHEVKKARVLNGQNSARQQKFKQKLKSAESKQNSSLQDRAKRGQSLIYHFPEDPLARLVTLLGPEISDCSLNNAERWHMGAFEQIYQAQGLLLLVHFVTDTLPRQSESRKRRKGELLDAAPIVQFTADLASSFLLPGFARVADAKDAIDGFFPKFLSLLARLSIMSKTMSSIATIKHTKTVFSPESILFLMATNPGMSIPSGIKLRCLERYVFDSENCPRKDRHYNIPSEHAARQAQKSLTAYAYSDDCFSKAERIYDATSNVLVGILIDVESVFKFVFKHRVAFEIANGVVFVELATTAAGVRRFDCNVVFRCDFFALGMFTAKQVGAFGWTPRHVNSKKCAYSFLFLQCKDNAENALLYAKGWFDKLQTVFDHGITIVDTVSGVTTLITFDKAIMCADGKAINEILQHGGAFGCAMCHGRIKERKFVSSKECTICQHTYGAGHFPDDRLCEHSLIAGSFQTHVSPDDDAADVPEDEAEGLQERGEVGPGGRRAGAAPPAILHQQRSPSLPSVLEVRSRQSADYFHFVKDKKLELQYIRQLERYNFSSNGVDNTVAGLTDVRIQSMTPSEAGIAITNWYKTALVLPYSRRHTDATIHTILPSVANLNRLGQTVGTMLSSLNQKKTCAEIVAFVASFAADEQRAGDGTFERAEVGLTPLEQQFKLYCRVLIAIYSQDDPAAAGPPPAAGGRIVTPLLKDVWRIVICLLHFRLRVCEKLVRLLVFVVLESSLGSEVKKQRIAAMEDVINEICSKKLSLTKFFVLTLDLKKSGGYTVKFNLQGNKLATCFELANLVAFIKAAIHDDEDCFTGEVNQTSLIRLFSLYAESIANLSKNEHVFDPVTNSKQTKYTKLTDVEIANFQKTADDFGNLYKKMFGRSEITPYLHWIFSGHGLETLRKHGCLKDAEGQGWEGYMGVLKAEIKGCSNRAGGRTDEGGILTTLMRCNVHKLIFNCVNSAQKPPSRIDHAWFFEGLEAHKVELQSRGTAERKSRVDNTRVGVGAVVGGVGRAAVVVVGDDDNEEDEEIREEERKEEEEEMEEVEDENADQEGKENDEGDEMDRFEEDEQFFLNTILGV